MNWFKGCAIVLTLVLLHSVAANGAEPIPDKLVVLTFDDGSKSHYTVARPVLKRLGFGATFFITEGFDFRDNQRDYMTWDEIAELHRDGFEIGNHTGNHKAVTAKTLESLSEQVQVISDRCQDHGIPPPVSFAYPGNGIIPEALPILQRSGIQFARRGGVPEFPYEQGRGFAYEPGLDHPLLIPSAGDARPGWTLEDFERAVSQARHGRIAVLQFHGVPDTAHGHVSTSREQFESYMQYLAEHDYRVIALRELNRFVDRDVVPKNPLGVIEDRKRLVAADSSGDNSRPPEDDGGLRYWLENMILYHKFSISEIEAATGLPADTVDAAIARFGLQRPSGVTTSRSKSDPLLVLPYPGGRHPRIGFLDGAIRPQRESKISVFAPWPHGGYVVVDVPEAIWSRSDPEAGRELLYLAHTHVPTMWDKLGVTLEPLEWQRLEAGRLEIERRFPNHVTLAAQIHPQHDGVRMELRLTNGSSARLTDLVVQNCVMLKAAAGFEDTTNDNKVLAKPFVACRDRSGKRWVITAWEPCERVWANPPCPCLHSDPKFPDCEPGQTQTVRGWLSFFEGADVIPEIERLKQTKFQ